MNRWKTILIGAGKMGKNHLRVLLEDPRFDVVAVVDPRAADIFREPKFLTATSLGELGDLGWDCAVVAAPTPLHFPIGRELIARGKPILMEKPLAATPPECDELVTMVEARGVKMAVGHLERFNPAVRKVSELIRSGWLGRTVHFSFTRVGGYPEGITTGDNVLIDLAIHDLDILRFLVGPVVVRASVCHSAWRAGVFDTAEILLTADGGQSASIHTNWVTPTKLRTLRVTGTRGVCFADYILQSCVMFGGNMLRKMAAEEFDFRSLIEDYKSTDRVEFGIVKQEPLKVQLDMFYRMLAGQTTEICSPREAAAAVALANQAISVALRSVHDPAGEITHESQDP
jgi:UDP-N-acetylglucosamine 3-dehydrogenase